VALALATAACVPVAEPPPPDPCVAPSGVLTQTPAAPPFVVGPTITREVVVSCLYAPWEVAFAPDGTMLFTERRGTINAVVDGAPRLLLQVPDVELPGAFGTRGLLGLAVDPEFGTSNRFIYTCLTTNTLGVLDNRVLRWTVDAAYTALSDRVDIVTGIPVGTDHNGCRVRFGAGAELWISTGDGNVTGLAQSPASLAGKTLRVDRDGVGVPGNPGVDDPPSGFDPRVHDFGHRNPQGLAFRASTGEMFQSEHGTDRDDEVNLLVAGGNYGWAPGPGYDQNVPMTDLVQFPSAVSAAWRSDFPTIAPSGMTFLVGSAWEGWDGALVVATLKGRHLRVMFLGPSGDVVSTTVALSVGVRLRSAVQGPDGNLYVVTDVGNGGGEIWKVTPS
jgi:glucose/arabinose dehydrogenase